MMRKMFAIFMFCIALIYMMREYFLIIVLLVIIIILIRFGADIFWWGKDNDKW